MAIKVKQPETWDCNSAYYGAGKRTGTEWRKSFSRPGTRSGGRTTPITKGKPAPKREGRNPKKSSGYLHQPLLARYQFISEQQATYSLERLCKALDVSVSGYYAWKKRPESKRKQQNKEIVEQIKIIHQQSRPTYGSARV